MATINDALRLARLYWGYSQRELSEALGISQSMLSEIESGRKAVSLKLIEKYGETLGVRPSQILFFAEEIEGEKLPDRGRLIVASKALTLLEKLKPSEPMDETGEEKHL